MISDNELRVRLISFSLMLFMLICFIPFRPSSSLFLATIVMFFGLVFHIFELWFRYKEIKRLRN